MVIFLFRSPIAQHSDLFRILGIVGCHHTGLAVGAEVFAWVEAKASHVAQAADAAPLVFRAMRLRRILNDDQAVLSRKLERLDPCPPAGRIDEPGSRPGSLT